MRRSVNRGLLLVAAAAFCACQSTTDPDDTVDVDDVIEATVSPSPAIAERSSGKFYRVVIGNNQPDEIREYDWKTTFTLTVTVNDRADDDDVDIAFPMDITTAPVTVAQATGGIVTPPTGAEKEQYESIIAHTSSNRFGGINSTNTLTFEVWYDLPNLRREALVTVALNFSDDDGTTFVKNVQVNVAP